MARRSKQQKPLQNIIRKITKYIIFTIAFSWSPMIFNWIIARSFNLIPKELYLYTSEIYFMTIILSSTNIKDILESEISNESFIFFIHIILNITNIVLCIIFISISSFIELSNIQFNNSIILKQFNFVISMYVLAVLLGSGVQVGSVIKQTIEKNKGR